MEVFFLLSILAIVCCGLPLLILGVAALFKRGKARLREIPSAPPLTQDSEEVNHPLQHS